MKDLGFEFRASGFEFRIKLGSRSFSDSESRIPNSEFQVSDFWGSGFGFRVSGLYRAVALCKVLGQNRLARRGRAQDLISTSSYDKHSGSTKITTHLDHISHRKAASGKDFSNRWTYRVFIIHTRRD